MLSIVVLSFAIVFSLIGCEAVNEEIHVNVENSDNLSNGVFGESAMVEIGDGLWYDSTTRIVYWWNGYFGGCDYAATPSPYYAPNGFPYTYNPETNTFKEIG